MHFDTTVYYYYYIVFLLALDNGTILQSFELDIKIRL